MLKEGSFLRHLVLDKLKAANITPNIVLESNQIETIKGLVSSGVGLAFLLDFIVDGTPGIKALPLDEPIFVDVGLAWKKDRYISKAAQSFMNETISLSDRFGLIINYRSPNQDEYLAIIDHYLRQEGVCLEKEELRVLGHRWELEHSGRSGRTARQFVDYYLGQR